MNILNFNLISNQAGDSNNKEKKSISCARVIEKKKNIIIQCFYNFLINLLQNNKKHKVINLM